jgi:uncharacterized GH25 family protein
VRRQVTVGLLAAGLLIVAGVSYALTRSRHAYQDVAEASGRITGRVLDDKGQPVAEAQVYADRVDSPLGRRVPFVLTDKEGEFLIKDLEPGTYTISAAKEADGYAPTDSPFHSVNLPAPPQVTVYAQQNVSDVVLYFGSKAAKLVGRVTDTVTNKPIKNSQGLQITLRRADNQDYSYSTGLEPNGGFSILVPSVPFTVEVSAPGYEKRHLASPQLIPGQVKRLEIALRPAK